MNEHDGYKIEENDDPRTWGDGLTPDCETGDYKQIAYDPDEAPFDESEKLKEYYRIFNDLIYSVGRLAYYWKMLKNIHIGAPPVDEVAKKYGHSTRYYSEMKDDWEKQSRKTLKLLKEYNYLGHKFPYRDNDFLNALVNEDRRASYYGTIKYGKKKEKYFSYEDFEARYQKRLEKRQTKN